MENSVLLGEEKEHFLVHSKLFLGAFEVSFREYFTALLKTLDDDIHDEEIARLAEMFYTALFQCEKEIASLKQALLVALRYEEIKMKFLVTRTLFYVIEQYIAFCHERKSVSYLELLCECVQRFITVCEQKETEVFSLNALNDFAFSDDMVLTHTNVIMESFHRMQEVGEKVIFLNLYKGVPISSEAIIVAIDGESVSFKVDALQAIAIKMDNHAFIVKNSYFTKHMKADVVSYNFQTNTVTLSNFIYLLNMPALQRESIRVHPDIVATVHLHQFNTRQTSGRLYDLSMNGLGVVSNENNGIFVGAHVMIEFELNGMSEDRRVELQGEVINIIEYNDSYRYCMRIFPDYIMSQKILDYITKREKEILEELHSELQEYTI